jgi:rfaE bifunctional protein nucleotidyltransferase chain/domain
MNSKIVDLETLAARSEEVRKQGKALVVTNGCFDLLHVGHVRYLNAARALGDVLAVGVNGDRSVTQLKGPGRPINNERDRSEVVAALQTVDLVAIFPELRATEFIRAARPTIYVKGGDYKVETLDPDERAALQEVGATIQIIPFEKGYSTSSLLARLC